MALGLLPVACAHGEGRGVQQAHQLGMAWARGTGDDVCNGEGCRLRAQRPVHAAVVQAGPALLLWVPGGHLLTAALCLALGQTRLTNKASERYVA